MSGPGGFEVAKRLLCRVHRRFASQAVLLAARLFPVVDSERGVEHIACRPGKLAQAAPLPPRLASPHTDTPGTATSFHHNVSIVDGQSSPELGAYGLCAILPLP